MRKNLPRNTHDKKSWTHEIPARKNFDGTRSKRTAMAQDLRNLAHSDNSILIRTDFFYLLLLIEQFKIVYCIYLPVLVNL